jgi:hypothetical protein
LRVDQPSLDDAFVALTRDEHNTDDSAAGHARARKGELA